MSCSLPLNSSPSWRYTFFPLNHGGGSWEEAHAPWIFSRAAVTPRYRRHARPTHIGPHLSSSILCRFIPPAGTVTGVNYAKMRSG